MNPTSLAIICHVVFDCHIERLILLGNDDFAALYLHPYNQPAITRFYARHGARSFGDGTSNAA